MAIIASVFFLFAALCLVVGGLAAARTLPGNSYVGLRIEEVRKSQEIWELAHAVAGPIWALGGLAFLFGGFASLKVSGTGWVLPGVCAIVGILALSVGSNMGARAAFLADQATPDEGCGDSCNCGDGGCGSESAPAPAPDLDALRNAAARADQNATPKTDQGDN